MTKATPTRTPSIPGGFKVFVDTETPNLRVYRAGQTFPISARPCVGNYNAVRCARFNPSVEVPYLPKPPNANDMYRQLSLEADRKISPAKNKAYKKFVSRVQNEVSAMLLVDLGESKKSYAMISARLKQLRDAYNGLKRGHWKRVASVLQIPPSTVNRKYGGRRLQYGRTSFKQSLANQWLELRFGWVPLMEDIFNSVEILQAPLDNYRSVAASGREPLDSYSKDLYSLFQTTGYTRVGYRANVRVTNPRLAEANRLGLVNPASVAWELLPFSFVIDWFVDVGSVIGSLTDLAGVEVTDVQLNTKFSAEHLMDIKYPFPDGSFHKCSASYVMEAFSRESASIEPPSLEFTNPVGGKIRSLNQLALLVQTFSKTNPRKLI